MNIDKGYGFICELWSSLDGDNKNVILPQSLCKLKDMFEEEIRIQAAKTCGGASMVKRLKAASKYINKLGKKDSKFANAWIQDDMLCFTNGYTGFMLKDKLDLPIGERQFDLVKCFPSDARSQVEVDLVDVKTNIKIHKAKESGKKAKDKTKPIYKLGNAYYNPNYILECYEILGENVVFMETGNQLSPAVLESENGKAVLLPVRPPKDNN